MLNCGVGGRETRQSGLSEMKPHLANNGGAIDPESLIADARTGAEGALDLLIELLGEQLWAELGHRKLRYLSPSSTVSDLIQETVIRARERFSKFDKDTFGEFKRWARGILFTRRRYMMRRHRTRTSERVKRRIWLAAALRKNLPGDADSGSVVEDRLERREEAALAFAKFQRLKPHEQFILNLRVVEGLPFKSIASLVNSTESAVTQACRRALERLRTRCEFHDEL